MKTFQLKSELDGFYMVKVKKRTATFIWSSTPDNPLKNSIDLKVKINFSELAQLAEKLQCMVYGNKIFLPKFDIYNRIIIYASVRPTLRSENKIKKLIECVMELNSWDALYWASKFREEWWNYSNLKKLTVIAKAFKLFFNID